MPLNQTVNANSAPRCQHIKTSGAACAAPARRGRRFCCFHDSAARRNQDFVLPIIEDAHSLQLALNKILQALVDKRIDQKTATTLLYGLQLALANMKELKHEQFLEKCDRERAQREAYAQAQAADEDEEEYEDDEEQEGQEDGASEEEPEEAEAPHSSLPPCPPCLSGESPAAQSAPAGSDVRGTVDDFLRKFLQEQSRTAGPDHTACPERSKGITRSQSLPRAEQGDHPLKGAFDIDACAQDPHSFVSPCLRASVVMCTQSAIDNRQSSIPFGPITEPAPSAARGSPDHLIPW